MVDHHTTLLHYFFQVPVAQRIGGVPPNANQNYVDRKSHPFGIQHGRSLIFPRQQSTGRRGHFA
jgi:hypothetical protein